MKLLLMIALGGALGAVSRYGVSNGVHYFLGRGFPYGTLLVNVSGSLLMGYFSVLLLQRLSDGSALRALILVGLLGAFTTFSTFSLETLQLLEQGNVIKALLNVFFSVGLCLMAVYMGMILGRQ